MQKKQIIFTADCVLNLDDFGELKDYSDTIQEQYNRLNKGSFNQQILTEILDADPQDTFHVPHFQDIIKLAIKIESQLPQNIIIKLYKVMETIYEDQFFNGTFKQDMINQIYNKLTKVTQVKLKVQANRQLFMDNFYKFIEQLALKINYVGEEDLKKILQIIITLSEADCLNQQQADKYLIAMQFFLRNYKLRIFIDEKINSMEGYWLLKMKFYLWKKDYIQAQQCWKKLQQSTSKKYFQNSLQYWKQKLFKS